MACTNRREFEKQSLTKVNSDYIKDRSIFAAPLSNHFPDKIVKPKNKLICNTDRAKNNFSLFLFEYQLTEKELDRVVRKATIHSIAQYSSTDSCNFIVNRFESRATSENFSMPKITDTAQIDKPCFKDKYPIPNFIDYSIEEGVDFWKEPGFEIFVLDAGSNSKFNTFNLTPNYQMPEIWKNGYSKGIALNFRKKMVIYWLIVW